MLGDEGVIEASLAVGGCGSSGGASDVSDKPLTWLALCNLLPEGVADSEKSFPKGMGGI